MTNPHERAADFNARMKAKKSLQRMREGCDYVEMAGCVCTKCGHVHADLPVRLIYEACRRNVQTIRNMARERDAQTTGPTPMTTLRRTCDVVMADLDLLARDIGAAGMMDE